MFVTSEATKRVREMIEIRFPVFAEVSKLISAARKGSDWLRTVSEHWFRVRFSIGDIKKPFTYTHQEHKATAKSLFN